MSIEQEYKNLEIVKLKRDMKWFWPRNILEGIIAGLVLGGAFLILPNNYFDSLKTDIQMKESTLKINKLEYETLQATYLKENEELVAEQSALKDKNDVQKQKYDKREKEHQKNLLILSNKEKEIESLRNELSDNSNNITITTKLKAERSKLNKKISELESQHILVTKENKSYLTKIHELESGSKKDIVVVSMAENILSDGKFYDGTVYLFGGINKDKLSSMKRNFKERDNESEVYGMIDTTLSGSARDGFLFYGCYFLYSEGDVKDKISYRSAFDDVMIKESGSTELLINGVKVDVLSGDITANKIIKTIEGIKNRLVDTCR